MAGLRTRLGQFEIEQAFLYRALRLVLFGDVVPDIGSAEGRACLVDQRDKEFLQPYLAPAGERALDDARLATRPRMPASRRCSFGGKAPFGAQARQFLLAEQVERPLAGTDELPAIVEQHHGIAFRRIDQHVEGPLFARSRHRQAVFHLFERVFELADFILGRAVEQDALGRRHAVDPRRQPRDPQRHRAMEDRGQYQAQRKRADQRDEADPLGLRERMRAQDPLRQDRQHNPVRGV